MKRTGKKIAILLGIFIAAVAVYFAWGKRAEAPSDTVVYTSMGESGLPVIYAAMCGRQMNRMQGYRQDMGQAAIRDSLTLLPEDRALPLQIVNYDGQIEGISYEIRSLDLERLVERTSLREWESQESGISAVLPIQNLLVKDKEYFLTLFLDTPDYGTIRYYTRIMWTDAANAEAMIDLAVDFTNKTFDYEQARELTTYLEANDSEDNSSLGRVTIHSSFSQLTWAGLAMEPAGKVDVTLKDLDGIMCGVLLSYGVTRQTEEGTEELYEVEDSFTMKWDNRRIYLMDFERHTNQVFSGRKELFSGKRIMLGILNENAAATSVSPGGVCTAYVVNRDLWCYNEDTKKAVNVFSFRDGKADVPVSGSRDHDIKVLSVSDEGDVSFVVYGYMNRGIHEGMVGAALYQYNSGDNGIEERFFTPVALSFEMLKAEVGKLSHLGSNGMFYLMADHAVYGIDLNSSEYMVLADSLMEGGFAVSASERRFAWQEGNDPYGSKVIHLMDLDSGAKQEITSEEGTILRVLGFVGDDFIVGMAQEGDIWVQNGRAKDMPMLQVQIRDTAGNVIKDYKYDDAYIANVSVDESRIHLSKIVKIGEQSYAVSKRDTIVCNESLETDELEGIGWYASEERRKLYFVQLRQEVAGREVKVSVPKKVLYEHTQVVELKSNTRNEEAVYYAYGGGHYLGSSRNFTDALNLAYDRMGVVTDHNRNIVWDRVNRPPVKIIKDPMKTGALFLHHVSSFTGSRQYEDGILLLDARGCTLNQVLYFIGRGCPVVVYTESGGYFLLTGYDQYNITIYQPESGETRKMGLKDAADYISTLGNDFVCGVFTD